MKQIIIKYILARLREASTWRGIIMLIAGTWATQHPEQAEAIIPIAIAIVGSIGAFLPDNKNTAAENAEIEYQEDNPDDNHRTKPVTRRVPYEEPEEPSSGWGDKS
jgi:hypothetical protein